MCEEALMRQLSISQASHKLSSAPLVCICSEDAYIANNMDRDQTAPLDQGS